MSVKSTRLVKERKTTEMAENIYSKFDRNENGSLQYLLYCPLWFLQNTNGRVVCSCFRMRRWSVSSLNRSRNTQFSELFFILAVRLEEPNFYENWSQVLNWSTGRPKKRSNFKHFMTNKSAMNWLLATFFMDCYHADKRVFDFGMIFCPLGLKKGKIDELYYTNFAEILILI